MTLLDGVVVKIVPQSSNGAGNEPWRAVSTAFQDDALFQEYMDILKAKREEEFPEEDPGA